MVRTTKSTPATATTATENVVVEKTKRVKKEKVETPSATPAKVETTEAFEDPTVLTKFSEYSAKIQELVSMLSTMKSDFKTLEKVVNRELKTAQKSSGKKKKSNASRQPSGFVKPTKISEELAAFLGKEKGVEMARTEVSKEINGYIRAKSLQDKENGRKIHPDAALKKLLNIGKDDELTYFNLQRYMKHHFIKKSPAV
jgi:chromatin remodeling complex protein RSC6